VDTIAAPTWAAGVRWSNLRIHFIPGLGEMCARLRDGSGTVRKSECHGELSSIKTCLGKPSHAVVAQGVASTSLQRLKVGAVLIRRHRSDPTWPSRLGTISRAVGWTGLHSNAMAKSTTVS
jgi:hypothetical protein